MGLSLVRPGLPLGHPKIAPDVYAFVCIVMEFGAESCIGCGKIVTISKTVFVDSLRYRIVGVRIGKTSFGRMTIGASLPDRC